MLESTDDTSLAIKYVCQPCHYNNNNIVNRKNSPPKSEDSDSELRRNRGEETAVASATMASTTSSSSAVVSGTASPSTATAGDEMEPLQNMNLKLLERTTYGARDSSRLGNNCLNFFGN